MMPFPFGEERFLLFSDAAWGNAAKGGSQGAFLITVVDEQVFSGQQGRMSIVQWKSGRVRRVCVSSLAAETLSLVNALNHLEWARCFWSEITDAGFRLQNWEEHVGKNSFVCATDAKSIYDHISKPTVSVGADKRAAIDLQFVREVLARDGSVLKWIDGRYQLADDLTKLNTGDLIRGAMREAKIMLTHETEALRRRERERDRRRQVSASKSSELREAKLKRLDKLQKALWSWSSMN